MPLSELFPHDLFTLFPLLLAFGWGLSGCLLCFILLCGDAV